MREAASNAAQVRYDGPRDPSNPNVPDPLEQMAVEIVNQIFPDQDTAPAEYCAGEKDPA